MGGLSAVLGGLLAGLTNFVTGDYPKAELQPDGSIATQFNSFITITGTPEFQAAAFRDLNLIAASAQAARRYSNLWPPPASTSPFILIRNPPERPAIGPGQIRHQPAPTRLVI